MKDSKPLNSDVTVYFAVYGVNAVFDKEGVHHEEEKMMET